MWTARSTQLLERRLLMIGSVLFHFGMLAVIGGHLLGILVPRSATEAVGISDDAYHWLAVMGGLAASALVAAGIAVLAYRRLTVDRVAATTLRSDRILYPLLVLTIVAGIAATIDTVADRYAYRETVSPWFRGIFTLQPDGQLMVGRALRLPAPRRHGLAPLRGLALHPPRPRLERPRHLPRTRPHPLPAPNPTADAASVRLTVYGRAGGSATAMS